MNTYPDDVESVSKVLYNLSVAVKDCDVTKQDLITELLDLIRSMCNEHDV